MNAFELYNPVKLVLGEHKIETIAKYIPKGSRVLMTYGGGSIKQNGIYDKIVTALKDYQLIEFGGIEPNPRYETLMQGVLLARQHQLNFILAVGGGSVIDGTKFIAAAVQYPNEAWDIIKSGGRVITEVLPFGSVLTLPATGSEMNSGSVITRQETSEKLVFKHPLCFPRFSILDPAVVASLPKRQIANGIVDAFVHVLEQYLTFSENSAPIQDGFSETILKTLISEGGKVFNNPKDIEAVKNFMFSTSMALNGLIGSGVPQDWSTHMIGHELTALFGIDHARTLAMILPNIWRVNFDAKKKKLAQYAEKVWQLSGDEDTLALRAIEKTELFFQSLGVKTELNQTILEDKRVLEIPKRMQERAWKLGEQQDIDFRKVEDILKL